MTFQPALRLLSLSRFLWVKDLRHTPATQKQRHKCCGVSEGKRGHSLSLLCVQPLIPYTHIQVQLTLPSVQWRAHMSTVTI